jgi:hypothetical protein
MQDIELNPTITREQKDMDFILDINSSSSNKLAIWGDN